MGIGASNDGGHLTHDTGPSFRSRSAPNRIRAFSMGGGLCHGVEHALSRCCPSSRRSRGLCLLGSFQTTSMQHHDGASGALNPTPSAFNEMEPILLTLPAMPLMVDSDHMESRCRILHQFERACDGPDLGTGHWEHPDVMSCEKPGDLISVNLGDDS